MRRIPNLSWILLVVAAVIQTPAHADSDPPAPARIPMQMLGAHPVVEVRLQGHDAPLRMIVDTAAGRTILDEAVADRLDLRDHAKDGVEVRGAASTTKGVAVGKRLRLELGEFVFDISPLIYAVNAANDPVQYDGILGNDILRTLDVRFDLPTGALTLAVPGTQPGWSAQGRCMANASTDGPKGFGFIDGRIAYGDTATEMRAVLDTGAAQSVINLPALRALGLKPGDAALRVRDAGTRGFGEGKIDTWLLNATDLNLGGWAAGPMEVRVSDLPVFDHIKLKERPAMILGIDVLARKAITLHSGMRTICLG